MARILSQTLIRESQTLARDPPPSHILSAARSSLLRPSSRLVSFRRRSHRSGKAAAQLVEVDLEAEVSAAGGEVEVLGLRRLEDAIHGIIVRRSAPDWLPFIPGSSYWVPPPRQRALGIVELVGRLANPMTEEEALSLTTVRGWPSMAYFVEGATPHPHVEKSSESNTAAAAAQSDNDDE